MTLVMAMPGKDFIILGVDSRGVMQDNAGNRIEINTIDKLIPITNHVAILMYGEAAEGNQLINKFKSEPKLKKIDGVEEVAEKFAEFCRKEFSKLAGIPIQHLPQFGFLIAGLNKEGKIYKKPFIYNLRSTNGFMLGLCDASDAIKGQPIIALYKFAKEYKENMNVPNLVKFVAQCIYDTIRINGDVGGEIKMAIISKSGIDSILPGDVKKSIMEWETEDVTRIIDE